MNKDQTKAVDTILELASQKNSTSWYGLYGGAGVGKTYTIKHLIEEATKQGRSVAITATTGKAASLIGGQTLHSYLGMRMTINQMADNEEDALQIGKPTADVNADILIIDEASMLDRKTVLAVQGIESRFRVVLLVGDTDQLPPVKSVKPNLFGIDHIVLKKQQRMKNPAMQSLANAMKKLISDDLSYVDLEEYVDNKSVHIIDEIPKIKAGQCALAYHNKKVEQYIPEEHGDDYNLFNGVTISTISKRGIQTEALYPNGYDLRLELRPIESANLSVTQKGGHYRKGSQLFPKTECPNLYLATDEEGNNFIVHKGSRTELDKMRADLFYEAKDYREKLLNKYKKAGKLYEWKTKFDKEELDKWNSLWSEYARIAEIVHIRPTESRTIHKSQGSTITDVFVDMDDIHKAKGEILHALYVAFTRATDNLYIKGHSDNLRIWGANS